MNSITPNQQGIILITALLYLLVVTLLVMSAFSTSILQAHMAAHFSDEIHAFQQAETVLLAAEKAIHGEELEGQGSSNRSFYHYKRRAENACGNYYHIDVTGTFNTAKRMLESVLWVPVPTHEKCSEGISARKRVWWHSD